MPNRKQVVDYFRSIIHPNPKVKVCHRCGRLMNYERITIRKNKKVIEKLIKIKPDMITPTYNWHGFKLCQPCFKDKENNIICQSVDLEHIEKMNLTYAYIHKQL